MNRLSRAGIAVALLASVLWSGGVAEAGRLAVDESVCVNASSGVVSLVTYNTRFCSTQNWSDSKPAPPLCWLDSSTVRQDLRRSISVAPASGCILPFRSVPAGEVLLLCADGLSGLLRWPVTGACFSYNWKTWVRSASAPNLASPPTDFTTTSTTSTTAVVVPSVSLTATWIQSNTFPKAVTVTANVAGTIYFAEGAFVVKTVSDITSAPSYRWAKGTVTSANTPTSIAIDVDALTNGYYRVFVANSQGVLSVPATNIVTVSVPRTPTAAEIAAGTTTSTTIALTCATGGSCTVGVDTGPGGGPVFYYSATAFTSTGSTCNTNCHYLEAAPVDSSSTVWATTDEMCYDPANGSNNNSCQTFSIYSGNISAQAASRTAALDIGKGMANTEGFAGRLAGYPSNSTNFATGVAWAYVNNSKIDWFLPSFAELNQLCRYAWKMTVDNTATTCTGMSGTIRGGFSTYYWSSSEGGVSTAYLKGFDDGYVYNTSKSSFGAVRPVRAF